VSTKHPSQNRRERPSKIDGVALAMKALGKTLEIRAA
jgi:hypothetical protein